MWCARREFCGAWLCAVATAACAGEPPGLPSVSSGSEGSSGTTVASSTSAETTVGPDPDTATTGSTSAGSDDGTGTTGETVLCEGPLGLCHALGSVVVLPEDLTSIAHGNFDGDEYEDVVVGAGSRTQVHVAFGTAFNPLQAPQGYSTQFDTDVVDVAVADLDGDGVLDIVAAHPLDLTLLRGAPDGTFSIAGQVGVGSSVLDLAIGDFFPDQSPTIVTVGAQLRLFTSLGRGPFEYFVATSAPLGSNSAQRSLTVGNLDPSATPAIGLTHRDASLVSTHVLERIDVVQASSLSLGLPVAITAADFDGAGLDELVVASGSGDAVIVHQLGPNGDFAELARAEPAYDVTALEVVDFNIDGNLDILFGTDGDPGAIVVFLGDAGFSFIGPFEFLANEALVDLTVGDFNGDGIPDAAGVGMSSITLVLSTPTNAG